MKIAEINGIQLFHGDCFEVEPWELADGPCVLITDPPYGIAYASGWGGATWSRTRAIHGDDDTSSRDAVLDIFRARGWPWAVCAAGAGETLEGQIAHLIWDKGGAFGMGDLSVPWKKNFESILVGGKGWQGKRTTGVLRGHSAPGTVAKGRSHPHEKPASLFGELIEKIPSELTIIDPFCGTGPVLEAALLRGRKAIGVEIDERWIPKAKYRLSQRTLLFDA